jgi:(p)ppGpp synthase/HD superfamily hydrolase
MNKFEKKLLTLRQQFVGARYHHALAALEFAHRFHTGLRKDGVTPEFQHQIEIALFALTLPDLMFREEVIATILLHDVREDYDITDREIRDLFFQDSEFAIRVARAVENMTKVFRGVKKNEAALFDAMGQDPIASIAKGCDRMHNLQSMVGVFKLAKQKAYIQEVHDLFLPMLKKARRLFPHQVNAYENIKHILQSQIQLIEAVHDATDATVLGV